MTQSMQNSHNRRASQYSYEDSPESAHSDDSEVFVGLDSSRYGKSQTKKSKKKKDLAIKTEYEEKKQAHKERV